MGIYEWTNPFVPYQGNSDDNIRENLIQSVFLFGETNLMSYITQGTEDWPSFRQTLKNDDPQQNASALFNAYAKKN